MQRQQNALPPAQGRLDRVAQPEANLLVNDQPIHDRLDGVPLLRVQFYADAAGQLDQLTVHAGADEALAGQPLDHVAELALLVADNRSEQHDPRPRRQREDFVHNVAGSLAHDGHAGFRAVGLADVRVEQAQVVVNLRRGGDDRARAGAGAALLDGNCRGETLDEVHVRLLHLVQELPGIGGERLDVFALALGIDGVEGKRGLARTTQAGDDHQLVARDVQGEVLEVMLTRPANSDEFFAHGLDLRPLDNRAAPRATVGTRG